MDNGVPRLPPPMISCGVDEAGRGPMFGPLIVGAVYCGDDSVLKEIGVKDSKKLTPAQRERMFDQIDAAVPHWCTVPISAEEIDVQMKTQSLNMIELALFVEAVTAYPCETVYADCPDVNTERFAHIMEARMDGSRKVVAAHKADALYPVVSAASIMAKVTRDRMLDDLRKEFGADIGSGYPSDPATVAFIEKWIKDNGCAPRHTRTSWEPVRRMLSERKTTSLDDW